MVSCFFFIASSLHHYLFLKCPAPTYSKYCSSKVTKLLALLPAAMRSVSVVRGTSRSGHQTKRVTFAGNSRLSSIFFGLLNIPSASDLQPGWADCVRQLFRGGGAG